MDGPVTNTADHRENGHHRPGPVVLPPHATLDSLCRSVTELAKAADQQPRRITLRHGQTTVEMEWPDPAGTRPAAPPPAPAGPTAEGAAGPVATAAPASPPAVVDGAHPEHPARTAPAPQDAAPGMRYVQAPTVGTFYHAPEPGAPPFVAVGDLVRPGQPVGVLEVMKMMSTVEADSAGRVVEILVPNGQPVEYQQRLLAVEPLSGTGPG
ncbi:acetyl-CoA carboxylase biotin carboxyl carrier protein [Streptomyces coffeae]|uniref:Biotin carboxyl carrier protein of acetyl-CoA carboxylase n=1 Tax=Streptomyces coffeae TaxID=621382 RepID=A0ABS1NL72_9ACTN|nr:biotin/lipoyl-containing protein [Streptomyces coffeae]MBL1100834.1 acetyl-CoA carboxylase biotin carboxyl carrier protein subunit [Streptomyces coffeae]